MTQSKNISVRSSLRSKIAARRAPLWVTSLLFLTFSVFFFHSGKVFTQKMTTDELLGQLNTITTSVPFLLIAPDSKAGAMGDAGVATQPDANSMHWNPSKYAF